jgi:iron complex transport system ATP-binding protein
MTLAAHALDYGFRDHVVGRGVDLSLGSAQIACLLGPNGSGKTTLLRTLLGLLPPLGGQVTLDGAALAGWGARARAARLAYVPQAAESYFDFSVREMVEMGRTMHRGVFAQPGRADREHAHRALGRLGIERLADRPVNRVSGGERQLVLIARALATEATHLVMDEPTANLDFGNQARVLDEIERLGHAGVSVLFSTHHPDQALRIAGTAILLKDGAVMAAGPTRAVLTSESLSRLYGRELVVADSPGAPHPLIYRP